MPWVLLGDEESADAGGAGVDMNLGLLSSTVCMLSLGSSVLTSTDLFKTASR